MAVLKIRDADGKIHEISVIKGNDYILTEADKQEISDRVIGKKNKNLVFDTYDNLTNWFYKNFCPVPSKYQDDYAFEIQTNSLGNGLFNVSVKDKSGGLSFLMSPLEIHSVTLPAGTYTASGNSANIGFINKDAEDEWDMLQNLPYTFTLDSEKTVTFGTNKTDFSENNVYLQIERGTTATELEPYVATPYVREDGITKESLQVGDLLLVEEENQPNFYWNGTGIKAL